MGRNALLITFLLNRRKALVLDDDPNFVPIFDLPALEFDESGDLVLPDVGFSQGSKLNSQFSPLDQSSASPANAPFINLEIRRSFSQGSLGFAPFDKQGQSQLDDGIMFPMFCDEEELPFADLDLRIDPDGNIIEEPQLPPHPVEEVAENEEAPNKTHIDAHFPEDEAQLFPADDEYQVVLGDENQHPVAGPVAQGATQNDKNEVHLPSEEPLSPEPPQQPTQPRQQRKRKFYTLSLDEATHVGRAEFRSWDIEYMTRVVEGRSLPPKVTPTEARNNAYNLVFGMGISDVGIFHHILDLNHELAETFSGKELMRRVPGYEEVAVNRENRRRSASVAFGSDDEGDEDDRRVRARLDEDAAANAVQDNAAQEHDAQIIDDDAMAILGDDDNLLPEAGREVPGSALSDHRRSSNAPWNRPSSAVPSSVGKNVETGRQAVEGSPLVGRGSILQPQDVKFSDGGIPTFDSEGFAPLQSDGAADFSSYSEFGAAAGVPTQEADTSQFMRKALDREGRNFMGFVERVATDRGTEDAEHTNRRWVDFDGLFEEQDKTKTVVAQAFLHVLTLATKNQIKVMQDGVDKIPFGQIRVGVTVASDEANEVVEMESVEGDEV